jgi:hypothetical protein
MHEIFDIFSLTTEGDSPIGLKALHLNEKLSQPDIEEQKEYNFTPLFQQSQKFQFASNSIEEEEKSFFDLSWLSFTQEDE